MAIAFLISVLCVGVFVFVGWLTDQLLSGPAEASAARLRDVPEHPIRRGDSRGASTADHRGIGDLSDQVVVKEQEYKAIKASHSAMRSAMNILSGNSDQKYMYDMALEAMAEDVGQKVGEMERFMDMSKNFMDGIDLQNGVFEEEGMAMLEKWEKDGVSFLLGGDKNKIVAKANNPAETLDLNAPIAAPSKAERGGNQYDSFFES